METILLVRQREVEQQRTDLPEDISTSFQKTRECGHTDRMNLNLFEGKQDFCKEERFRLSSHPPLPPPPAPLLFALQLLIPFLLLFCLLPSILSCSPLSSFFLFFPLPPPLVSCPHLLFLSSSSSCRQHVEPSPWQRGEVTCAVDRQGMEGGMGGI